MQNLKLGICRDSSKEEISLPELGCWLIDHCGSMDRFGGCGDDYTCSDQGDCMDYGCNDGGYDDCPWDQVDDCPFDNICSPESVCDHCIWDVDHSSSGS